MDIFINPRIFGILLKPKNNKYFLKIHFVILRQYMLSLKKYLFFELTKYAISKNTQTSAKYESFCMSIN